MMRKIFYTVLFFLVLSFSVKAQTYNGDQKEIDTILKNIDSFSDSVMEGDIEAIGQAYTEDASILVNNRDIIKGRDKIEAYWTPGGSSRTIYHKIHPVEITITGDSAYDMGRYEGKTRTANGEEIEWKGKYVIIWKKINGSWKIYIDIWNRIE